MDQTSPRKTENGLNFPEKPGSAEEGLKLLAKRCSDSVPKPVSNAGLNFVNCFPNECLNIYKILMKHLLMLFQMLLPTDIVEFIKNCLKMKR